MVIWMEMEMGQERGKEMGNGSRRTLRRVASPLSVCCRYSCLISRSRRDVKPGNIVFPPLSTMRLYISGRMSIGTRSLIVWYSSSATPGAACEQHTRMLYTARCTAH